MLEARDVTCLWRLLSHAEPAWALQALRVLSLAPLSSSAWQALSPAVQALAARVVDAEEDRRAALESLASAPLGSVRKLLRERLANRGEVDEAALGALRSVRDASVAPWLSAILQDRQAEESRRAAAAEELALLAEPNVLCEDAALLVDELPDVRFWAGFARARFLAPEALIERLSSIARAESEAPRYFGHGFPGTATGKMQAAPLPREAVEALRRFVALAGADAPKLAGLILEANDSGWAKPPRAVALQDVEPAGGDLFRAREALASVADDAVRALERIQAANSAQLCMGIHEDFAQLVRTGAQGFSRGNAIVNAIGALGRDFVPRVELLHELARELLELSSYSRDVFDQLAWAALQPSWRDALALIDARAGDPEALRSLLGFLERGGQVAREGIPIRGSGGTVAMPSVVLIDDVSVIETGAAQPTLRGRDPGWGVGKSPPAGFGGPLLGGDLESSLADAQRASRGQSREPQEHGAKPHRIVSTGFSRATGEDFRDSTLMASTAYRFFVEIAARRAAMAIDDRTVELPVKNVPAGRRLRVSLFTFGDGFVVTEGEDFGDFIFLEDGSLAVCRRPGGTWLEVPTGPRLSFGVATSRCLGEQRLRCNIYLEGVLLLSKLVHATVAEKEVAALDALWTEADYVFSGTLDPELLRHSRPHALSIMLNDNGNGTHGFRFQSGKDDFKCDANLQDADVSNPVSSVRSRLCVASWGSPDELAPEQRATFRYAEPVSLDNLKKDLLSLARAGRRAWDALAHRLTRGEEAKLRELMVKPGRVQIVNRESARLVVPAAVFYDRPPRSAMKDDQVKLCGEFMSAMEAGRKLEEVSCFLGQCPNLTAQDVLCPSGFWGFRHRIGMPYSMGDEHDDAVNLILGTEPLSVLSGVATDLKEWREHLGRMVAMGFDPKAALTSVVDLLRKYSTGEQQLVYLYGHGGLHDDVPYFAIGLPGGEYLLRDSLQDFRPISSRRPLVFLNGCHSVGLAPNRAIELVSGFVQTGKASGVIGTEISVFEPLATTFAEACLERFVTRGQELGEAVLGARLDLLGKGNPLGLVYVPYAPADLRIEKRLPA